ncbi:MAG: amino acid ABC transporter permease [Terrimicrobiaceae bacterium]
MASVFLDRPRQPAPGWAKVLTGAVLLMAFSLICWTVLSSSARSAEILQNYRSVFIHGWLLTVGISSASLVLSILIGLVAALGKQSEIIIIRYISTIYIEIVRGMPFLALILILWFGIAPHFRLENRMAAGVLALSLFSGAYLAEMFRAGVESVGASQRESARAIGLSSFQTYWYVIFPQALRHTLPALTGQFASLIKDSSLLSIIGLSEFTYSAQQVFSATYSTMESFLPLAVGYLILTLPVSFWTKRLETTLRYET